MQGGPHSPGKKRERLGMSSSGPNSKSKYQEKDPAGTSIVSARILHPPSAEDQGLVSLGLAPCCQGHCSRLPIPPLPRAALASAQG